MHSHLPPAPLYDSSSLSLVLTHGGGIEITERDHRYNLERPWRDLGETLEHPMRYYRVGIDLV